MPYSIRLTVSLKEQAMSDKPAPNPRPSVEDVFKKVEEGMKPQPRPADTTK